MFSYISKCCRHYVCLNSFLCFEQKHLNLGLLFGLLVCRSSKQAWLWTSLVFKTRFAFNARGGHQPSTQRNKHSKQDLLWNCFCLFVSLRGVDISPQHKETKTIIIIKKKTWAELCQAQFKLGRAKLALPFKISVAFPVLRFEVVFH